MTRAVTALVVLALAAAACGGSSDETAEIAEAAGCMLLAASRGRGKQLAAGAGAARGEWLLFLHADTVLRAGWDVAVRAFIDDPVNARRAGYFRFALDDPGFAARRIERLVDLRCRKLGLPYGDQGLLMSREFYNELGGFKPIALMEDVDLVRRVARRRLVMLGATATTSAARYRRGGFWLRPIRNQFCLLLWFLGVPVRLIARIYG